MAPLDKRAQVVAHGQVGPGIYLLGLLAPEIRNSARPGQFCMIDPKAPGASDPLLRRPLSIHRVGPKGLLIFLYKVVGKGTALLAQLRPGEEVKVLGPIGNGFNVDETRPGLLVGGGMGVAPLVCLAESWRGNHPQVVIFGGRTKGDLEYAFRCLDDVKARVLLITEDGTMGEKGLVTDLIPKALEILEGEPVIYSCGPWPMMKAVYKIARKHQLACQVSLEAHMACGIGLCLGCAVKRAGGADSGYLHVCKEGPVFRAEEVEWGA